MKIELQFDARQIEAALEDERVALAKRLRLATEQAGRELLLLPARDITRSALHSSKLATTWRGRAFPKEPRNTLSPAFFVSTRAPAIIFAHETGPAIRPLGGKRYLWIPTENVPRGRGGKPLGPGELGPKLGGFKFLPLRNGGLAAYAMAARAMKRRHRRSGGHALGWKASDNKSNGERVIFYILKPQVRLRKRLDLARLAEAAGAKYAARYEQASNGS
jgi:hypothetical protein